MARIYRVCVDIPEPAYLGQDIGALFEAVSDAAFDWEPDERDGWDLDVYASVVEDPQ